MYPCIYFICWESFLIYAKVTKSIKLIINYKFIDFVNLAFFFYFGATAPQWAIASSFTRFLDRTQWRTTVGRTPLDEWSARRRDLYLTTHNTHNRQTSMPPVGFEPTIPAGERPQTHTLDRAAIGTGNFSIYIRKKPLKLTQTHRNMSECFRIQTLLLTYCEFVGLNNK